MSPEVETGTCGSIARHNSHQARYVAFWPASVSTDMANCGPVLGNFLLILQNVEFRRLKLYQKLE